MKICKRLKTSALLSVYSMLKATVQMKNDVNINTYVKLTSFLKSLSTGQKRHKRNFKKTFQNVLTMNHVETFINTARDVKYLATKVRNSHFCYYLIFLIL